MAAAGATMMALFRHLGKMAIPSQLILIPHVVMWATCYSNTANAISTAHNSPYSQLKNTSSYSFRYHPLWKCSFLARGVSALLTQTLISLGTSFTKQGLIYENIDFAKGILKKTMLAIRNTLILLRASLNKSIYLWIRYVSLCNTYTRTLVYVSLKHIHNNACICLSFRKTYTSVLVHVFQRDIYKRVCVCVAERHILYS